MTAKKKPASRKPRKKRGRPRKKKRSSFLNGYGALFLAGFFSALLLVGAVVWLTVDDDGAKPRSAPVVAKTVPHKKIAPKISPKPPHTQTASVATPKPSNITPELLDLPKITIIIDDLGVDLRAAERLLAIDGPITFAILPHQKYSWTIAERVHEKKRVVMLHLPMEPKSRILSPGAGALYTKYSAEKIKKTLLDDLGSFPHISGVNNHMGSLFTEQVDAMEVVMNELVTRKLFFVDSRTTAATVAYDTALRMGVPTAKRKIFLDNERDVALITAQLMEVIKKARSSGSAIGIGHPYPETISALEAMVPNLRQHGVILRPVTDLLE